MDKRIVWLENKKASGDPCILEHLPMGTPYQLISREGRYMSIHKIPDSRQLLLSIVCVLYHYGITVKVVE